MLLRSITKHVKDQNWFAVALDFAIVVFGILIAFQITNWNEARAQRVSEHDFIERLHQDVIELQGRRFQYDHDRPVLVNTQTIISEFLNAERDDVSAAEKLHIEEFPYVAKVEGFAASLVCNTIDWSHALTVPPAELPTANELISAGRVSDISSNTLKRALQTYLQQANRAEFYTQAISENTVLLSAKFPELFEIRHKKWAYNDVYGETFSHYLCDYNAMRSNDHFLNAYTLNAETFANYANRSVKPVSEKLNLLHTALDQELSISHETVQEAK